SSGWLGESVQRFIGRIECVQRPGGVDYRQPQQSARPLGVGIRCRAREDLSSSGRSREPEVPGGRVQRLQPSDVRIAGGERYFRARGNSVRTDQFNDRHAARGTACAADRILKPNVQLRYEAPERSGAFCCGRACEANASLSSSGKTIWGVMRSTALARAWPALCARLSLYFVWI